MIEDCDEVVGFGIANSGHRNIWALFIDPDHEGHGHGRRLLDAMTEWLWTIGSEPIWLSTDPGTRADAFYERAKWRRTELLPNGEIRFEKAEP